MIKCLRITHRPGFDPQYDLKVVVAAHACNPSTWKSATKGSAVQGYLTYRVQVKPEL